MEKSKYELEKSGAIVFFFSMLASGLNYLYQIVMGNLMCPADYGILNTLLSLTMIVSVPTGVLLVVASKFSASYNASGETDKLSFVFKKLSFWGAMGGILVLALGVFSFNIITATLKIDNKVYIAGVMIVVAISFFYSTNIGFLQGLKRFVPYSMINIIGPIVKLLFGVLFSWLGFGLYGIIVSLIFSALAIWMYSFLQLRDVAFKKTDFFCNFNFSEIFQYFKSIFLIQFILLFFTNGDILLIKCFVSNELEVGLYSAASVIGKIPMFISGAVVTTLFPIVATCHSNGEKTTKLLYKAFFYGGGSSLACTIVIMMAKNSLTAFLYGESYNDASIYLFPVSCFTFALVVLTIIVNYLNALGKTHVLTISLVLSCIGIFICVWFAHESISQILYILSFWLLGIAVYNFFNIIMTNRKLRKRDLP